MLMTHLEWDAVEANSGRRPFVCRIGRQLFPECQITRTWSPFLGFDDDEKEKGERVSPRLSVACLRGCLDGLVDHGPSAEATRDEGGGVGEPTCCLRCSLAIVVSVSTPRRSNIAGPSRRRRPWPSLPGR